MKQIVFLTDIHLDEQFPLDHNVDSKRNLDRVLFDLSARHIKDIVFGGDIGESSSHQWFFDRLKPFSLKLILGNHDNFKKVSEYYQIHTEKDALYYAHEDVNYKFLFLDTSSDALSNIQLEWLRSELTTNKKLLVFIHHPILAIDTPVDKLYPLKNREQLKSVLSEIKRSVTLFCGHYHMNDERTNKNIKQITTQSLSFQLVKQATELKVDNSNFGYRIINLETDKIKTEVVSFNA